MKGQGGLDEARRKLEGLGLEDDNEMEVEGEDGKGDDAEEVVGMEQEEQEDVKPPAAAAAAAAT